MDSETQRLDAQHAYTVAAYLRIASLAIAAYDFLETQPTTLKFYREHTHSRRISVSLVLFILVRFVSIITLVISSVGFFYGNFTPESCAQFYLYPPAFKVVQIMVSQLVLAVRTYNLSRRSPWVGSLLFFLYTAACVLQWITTMVNRTPQLGDTLGHDNCRAFNRVQKLGAWIFYAIAIIYDVLTTSLSVFYLLKYKLKTTNSMIVKVTRMMLYDGLGYLIVLTAINILNLILYKTSPEIQTAGSSLGYCVTWIMSQRLLIHLHQASREHENESFEAAVTFSKHITNNRDISRAVRSQFDHKASAVVFKDVARSAGGSVEGYDDTFSSMYPEDVDVRVRIERTVKTATHKRNYELEDYSRPSRHH